jgi:hypothetical protein
MIFFASLLLTWFIQVWGYGVPCRIRRKETEKQLALASARRSSIVRTLALEVAASTQDFESRLLAFIGYMPSDV